MSPDIRKTYQFIHFHYPYIFYSATIILQALKYGFPILCNTFFYKQKRQTCPVKKKVSTIIHFKCYFAVYKNIEQNISTLFLHLYFGFIFLLHINIERHIHIVLTTIFKDVYYMIFCRTYINIDKICHIVSQLLSYY